MWLAKTGQYTMNFTFCIPCGELNRRRRVFSNSFLNNVYRGIINRVQAITVNLNRHSGDYHKLICY